MHSPEQRRHRIRHLLAEYSVHSQAQLAELLAGERIRVNQATLSRDLRELGVVKGPDGYAAPADLIAPHDAHQLERAIAQWLRDAVPAANQIVLTTPPGGAQPLALAIDRASVDGILGTIAGDDTILAICPNASTAQRVASELLAAT